MRSHLLLFGTVLVMLLNTACATAPPVTATPTPTLAPGMGRIVGTLQVGSGENGKPAGDVILALGETIKDPNGDMSFASYDRINSPRTATDAQGHFVFSNIPPGEYGLILDMVTASYLLAKPGTPDPFLVQVIPDQQVDLGTLLYDSLPISPQPGAYPYP